MESGDIIVLESGCLRQMVESLKKPLLSCLLCLRETLIHFWKIVWENIVYMWNINTYLKTFYLYNNYKIFLKQEER